MLVQNDVAHVCRLRFNENWKNLKTSSVTYIICMENKESCYEVVKTAGSSVRFKCLICQRLLSSKRNVLTHLHSAHCLSKKEFIFCLLLLLFFVYILF